jgi:putative DNA primase/helicase
LAAIKQAAKTGKSTDTLQETLHELEGDKPEPPRVPKLLRGDDTPENLAWVLARQWPSAGVMTAEAGLVLGAHGMGAESVMRNLGLLNILWDGGTLAIGRRTSESFTVRGARLTMGLQVQEATLRSFFDRSKGLARGTGFLARFLISWPESTQGARPFSDPPDAWPLLATFHRRLSYILNTEAPIDKDGALSPTQLLLAPDTKAAWVAFHDEIEKKLRIGGELYDVRDVASKTADNAARLAALFQVFCSKSSNCSSSNVIAEYMESASRIVAWHLNESRRFFGELALPPELADPARLEAWLLNYCQRERVGQVPSRTVQQYGPSGLREKATIEAAMRELKDLGRARLVPEGRSKIIQVNPALLSGGEP